MQCRNCGNSTTNYPLILCGQCLDDEDQYPYDEDENLCAMCGVNLASRARIVHTAMTAKKIELQQVYIIDVMDFPSEKTEFVECPGNYTLEWYWIDGDPNEFQDWIRSQLPDDFTGDRVLLEWCW